MWKKLLLIPLAIICMGAVSMTALDTNENIWFSIGTIDATAAGSDVALAKTERSAVNTIALDNAVRLKIGQGINAAEFRFKFVTDNADVDIDVWGVRKGDDSLVYIATLDVIAGGQIAFTNGTATSYLFADTVNISNTALFLKTLYSVAPGTDQQARLVFDGCGYEQIIFHGYGTFDEDCIIEASGF